MRIFSAKMRPLKIVEPLKNEFGRCDTELITEEININAVENYGALKLGHNYLININETIFGKIIKVITIIN